GFLQRSNFDNLTWNFRYSPRLSNKLGVRKFLFKPWEMSYYRTHTTGQFESFSNETRPFGLLSNSGDRFEFNLQQFYDRLDQPFDLTDSIQIPIGKYWMNRTELQIESFAARKLWGTFNYNWGKFYTGHIQSLEVSAGITVNKHF